MRALRRFRSQWQNWLGLLLVLSFVLVAAAAPLLSPEDPDNPGPVKVVGRATDYRPRPPSPEAPLGTLPGQVSVYHSLVWGTRSAFRFGLSVAGLTALVGVLIGVTSAYFGSRFNDIVMRITDAFLSFPVIAGVVFIQQLANILLYDAGVRVFVPNPNRPGLVDIPQNLPLSLVLLQQIDPVMIAFILLSWMPYARILNTVTQRLKRTEFIQAARALGAGHARIIFRHLMPNAITPAVVLAARDVGGMVLLQATFTFVGMGGDSLWGTLLADGRGWIISPGGILTYWWVFLPATLALVLFGIGWNLIGDGLNEVLNPRTR